MATIVRSRLLGAISVLVLVASLAPPAGAGARSRPPSVCAALPSGRGMCGAYCDRLRCPTTFRPSCERLRARFLKRTGAGVFPCDSTDPLAALAGVYDVSGVAFIRPVAKFAAEGAIRVALNEFDSYQLDATPNSDGTLALSGYRIFGFDALLQTSGTASTTVSGGERRIEVSLTNAFGGDSFVLTRPLAGTPLSWAGRSTFAFEGSPSSCGCAPFTTCPCPSTATRVLTVDATGAGTLGGGDDVGAVGNVLGTFSDATCIVSPRGMVECIGRYTIAATGENAYLGMNGALEENGGAGRGGFLRGTPPLPFAQGVWSSTRAPTP